MPHTPTMSASGLSGSGSTFSSTMGTSQSGGHSAARGGGPSGGGGCGLASGGRTVDPRQFPRDRRLISQKVAGAEKDVQIDPAADRDPGEQVRDRAEVVERVEALAEGGVEQRLDAHEKPP